MNLKTFAKAVRRSAGKNASKILGGLAITGSITAVYFAVTATPKAMILLDEKKQELGVEKLDVKTIVKTAGPVYVPTALSMVLSAGCVWLTSKNLCEKIFSCVNPPLIIEWLHTNCF